jgi:metal-responsive CopG/Arc/MetJ family transcriptional regulator
MNEQKKSHQRAIKSISLRIPEDFINKIDNELEKRYGMKRTSWVMEAIQEKFKRDIKTE